MAFVSNMPDEEKQDPNAPQQGAISPTGGGSGAVQLAPSTAVAPAGGGTAGPSKAPNAAGGSFASLDKYLAANQGQAAPLAGKITNQIGQQYGGLDTQTNAAISSINNQITNASGYTPNNPNVLAQEAANPVSFAGNKENVKQFQSLLNNSYGGPASAEATTDYANQQAAINNAIATGKTNTTTEAGRENLLSQNETAPTTGVTALNSAILSQDPNALGAIQNAYTPFNSLLTNLNKGAQSANATIGKEQAEAAASSQAANKAIADQTAALNQDVQTNLDTANKGNQQFVKNYNELVGTLTHGGTSILSDEQAAQLGITPQQAEALAQAGGMANTGTYMTAPNFGVMSQTQDINNTQFLNQLSAPVAPTANQVATPEQFKQLLALLALNNGQAPTGALIDPAQVAIAGSYQAPTLKGAFDYDKALANVAAISSQERVAAQNQANSLAAAADAAHNASKSHTFGGNLLKSLNTGAQYLANPLTAVPKEVSATKKLASKI